MPIPTYAIELVCTVASALVLGLAIVVLALVT
jgi:hypothetical protein